MTSLSETSLLAGSSGQSTGYTIDQSIRFNKADSAYMSRTVGSGGLGWFWIITNDPAD